MNLETLRSFCLSLPNATNDMQWDCLLFRVTQKMFALAPLEPAGGPVLSFKCSDERFAELLEMPGVIPAPYLARAKWVALESWDTLRDSEIRALLTDAHEIISSKALRPSKKRTAKKADTKAKTARQESRSR